MPLNINACLCHSTSSIDSSVDTSFNSTHSTQGIHTSSGYVATRTNLKPPDIKPRVSCLHPKLRMSANEYSRYKKLMDSLGGSKKKVHFDESVFRNESSSPGTSDIKTSLTASVNALDDDDTDLVPFEEFEQWRLQRLQSQVSTTPSDWNTHPEGNQNAAFTIEQTIPSDYDIPRKQVISTDYDIPKNNQTVFKTA
ncbi:hypothetical protein [unidentified bacterial endosymbiont]|uniref:hypothetical protein n=1 Tax=unidentified bacterial endosymbiont TaxID=2355 RepID=UPI0020A2276D|nr:hypothetical protein [unidentified bacterial endosymbiont]